jgi:hypothetical protein
VSAPKNKTSLSETETLRRAQAELTAVDDALSLIDMAADGSLPTPARDQRMSLEQYQIYCIGTLAGRLVFIREHLARLAGDRDLIQRGE